MHLTMLIPVKYQKLRLTQSLYNCSTIMCKDKTTMWLLLCWCYFSVTTVVLVLHHSCKEVSITFTAVVFRTSFRLFMSSVK